MSIFDLFAKKGSRRRKDSALKPNIDAKCPNCGAEVNTRMHRCPKCGIHIDLMFRVKCPKCSAPNELDADKCSKCEEPLRHKKESAGSKKTYYYCPICHYKADFYMLKCPACGTRFS
jgi:DNA-directed RNA polymerase subunit RPC12/RpoP